MLRTSRGHILWSTVRLCHIFWCQSERKPFSRRGPKAMHPIMRLRGHQFHKRATSAMLTIDKDKRSPLPAYATQNFIGADFHNGQAFILLSHNDDKSPTCIIYGHRLMAFIFHGTRSEYSKRNDHLTSSDSGKGLPQNEQSKVRIFFRKDHAAARGEQADIELLQHPNVELEEWQHHSNLLWSGLDWGICNNRDPDHVGNYLEDGYYEWCFTFWPTDSEKTAKWLVEHDCFRFGLLTARMVKNSGVNCLSFVFIATLLLLQTPLRKKKMKSCENTKHQTLSTNLQCNCFMKEILRRLLWMVMKFCSSANWRN